VFRFAGMQHDTRDWLNALYDLRASGTRAYPITSAQVVRPISRATER